LKKDTIVGIIGAGTMGSGIAQVAATAGHSAILMDANNSVLEKAKTNLENSLKKLLEKGKISADEAKNIFGRIQFATDLSACKNCGLVIEAVVENAEVKQKLFSDLEKIIATDCVLATNTSSLSITSIASSCKNSERVIGIHFFNPAPLMPLVEIIPALGTEKKLVAEIKSLIDSWGKTTVLAKDTPGFIVNRVARSFYGESIRIYEEGIADFATIDWAMKDFGGFKMGPFELMDLNCVETIFLRPEIQTIAYSEKIIRSKALREKIGKRLLRLLGKCSEARTDAG
jgi:3-hydroxybutyryl-CoA dehydrogenase